MFNRRISLSVLVGALASMAGFSAGPELRAAAWAENLLNGPGRTTSHWSRPKNPNHGRRAHKSTPKHARKLARRKAAKARHQRRRVS